MKNSHSLIIALLAVITNLSSQTIDATLIELNFVNDSKPRNIVEHNNKLYFSATDDVYGRELWSLNLATNKANIIKDIKPGNHGGLENSNLVFVNDILFFLANDGVNGNELWRSDGTENGTYMIKNINSSSGSSIDNMISYNGKLIFSADDGVNGQELWVSNGEENGTHILKDINVGSNDSDISDIFEYNGILYFTADNGTNGREIWYSDGTIQGTSILKDIGVNTSGVPNNNNFIIFDDHFYFLAHEEKYSDYDLWKSDGTPSGTVLVKRINQNGLGAIFGAATNDFFVFMVVTPNLGRELWVSNGTETGTSLLKDINPSYGDGIPTFNKQIVASGDMVFFVGDNGINGRELWVTDGTSVGTEMVKDILPGSGSSGIVSITSNDEYVLFAAEDDYNVYTSLWKSDGTEVGTVKVKNIDLNKDYGYTMQFVPVNNKFYFQGADKTLNGIEIWETDGTTENTVLTVDINHRGSNTYPTFITEINEKSVMTSNNGLNGHEPFITDGTVSGTNMLKDIYPGYNSSVYVYEIPDFYYKKAGDYVFFPAGNGINGLELHRTDGTEEGTILVKDIAQGSASSLTRDQLSIVYNDNFYFKAKDQVHGGELWRTDGTESGTYMLKDIYPGSGHGIQTTNNQSGLNYHTVMNGVLYFNAHDGIENAIWKTDGTENGTVKAISIPSSGNNDRGPVVLNNSNGKLYFGTNPNNFTYGYFSLSVSDGTQSNITSLGTWLSAVHFENNKIYNNEFYFMVRDGFGLGLMKTDGTENGTVMVKGGMERTFVKYMDLCGEYLYFAVGEYSLYDFELWRTDGTSDGTILIAEESLRDYTCIENKLTYLKGTDDNNLWITDGTNKTHVNINVLNGEQLNNNNVAHIEGYVHDKLYFSARTARSGVEIYSAGVNEILSINDNDDSNKLENKIVIYPNPTRNSFNVTSNANWNIQTIELFDFSGKKIMSKKSDSKSVNLDISHLSKGLYLVKIKTDQSVFTKKIVLN